jgi:hypothetical protein
MTMTTEASAPTRPFGPATKGFEYRVERMPFQEHPEDHISELLERLNELGKQGWHAVSVDLTYHPSYSPAAQPGMPLPVLLEREVRG